MKKRLTIWRKIPGFFEYIASDKGKIMRVVSSKTSRVGKIIKPYLYKKGYLGVELKADNGMFYKIRIHQLVALAFLGPRPKGKEVNHKNYNKTDNAQSNLEYITHLENIHHAITNDHIGAYFGKGSKNVKAKINEESVLKIVTLFKSQPGLSKKDIATMFDLSYDIVKCILNGRTWSWLTGIGI